MLGALLSAERPLQTLRELDLCRTANLDADSSCESLAQIMATGPRLSTVNIRQQAGSRHVKVKLSDEFVAIEASNYSL